MAKDRGSEAARLLTLATTASVATAGILVIVKLAAWLVTGSVSVLASLVDSLMDVLASTINLVAVRYSLKPADPQHRFGHGKAESLAGLAQATFIAGSAVFLIIEAIDRLVHPEPLSQLTAGVAVMVFAMVATFALLTVQRFVIRRTGSTAIEADALHYATDFLTNGAALLALVMAGFGFSGVDPVLGLLIAAYILYSAWRISRDALQGLMDRELPDEQRARIQELAAAHEGVHGLHDLRTRQSGRTQIIQLHLELDGGMSLSRAHEIADAVAGSIRDEFPDADITIHQDPLGVEEDRLDDQLGGEAAPQGPRVE
jgi:ferrous-iron efflux pump FieF